MPAAFIARQPIFNDKLDVVGYELLSRQSGYAGDAPIDNPEQATATVVMNSLTELELGRIVGGKTAWINVSREFVVGGLAQVIPPDLVGLEISETEVFDDEMIAALRELEHLGYRLALDDFCNRPGSEALLDLFGVIKLNMPELGRRQLTAQVERLRHHGSVLLADKLATRADHEFCVSAGCDLFQGYFFCRPAVMGTRGIAANRLALLQVLAALQGPNVELSHVEQLITRDVALSYRMLRYVNSAFFGLRGDVRSIGQALALLGIENLRRWATLSVMASVDDKPAELTVTALIRARFCELAGEPLGIASPAELFTLGLFSVIDAMMDAPMQDVVDSLPLADDMREALISRHGTMGLLLNCVTGLEAGDSDTQSLIVRPEERYLEALMWADAAAESLFGTAGDGAATAPVTPAATADVRTRHLAADGDGASAHASRLVQDPPASGPTTVSPGNDADHEPEPAAALVRDPQPRGGLIARILAALFGRRDPRPAGLDRPAR
jgi:EAL and modified HD-GYP domain-containing signal transduction protein